MHTFQKSSPMPKARTVALTAIVVVGLSFAGMFQGMGAVQAEVRTSGAPAHFKSGAERSEIVLREIAATLKRIDARLERLEKKVLVPGRD